MEKKKPIIMYVLYGITVLLLAWILLPTFSFAKVAMDNKASVSLLNSEIEISNAWAKPTLKGRDVGVAYITLKNTSDQAVSLVSATTDVAKKSEIHTHIHNENGTMQMREVPKLELPSHQEQVFKPGGLHLMLFGLKQPLVEAEKFTITLTFDDKSTQHVEVAVRNNGE